MRSRNFHWFLALALVALLSSVFVHRPRPNRNTLRKSDRPDSLELAQPPQPVSKTVRPLLDTHSWAAFLTRYSEELLATDDSRIVVPEEARHTRWMGFEAATPAAIAAAEQRLGRKLPPSLRAFYSVSNGWRHTGFFIWDVLPVESIGWLCERDPHLYQMVCKTEAVPGPFKDDPGSARLKRFREEQGTRVKRALVVSSWGEAAVWLLDPGSAPHAEEWPGGRWAAWNPAMDWTAVSFADLMQQEYESFVRLRDRK